MLKNVKFRGVNAHKTITLSKYVTTQVQDIINKNRNEEFARAAVSGRTNKVSARAEYT